MHLLLRRFGALQALFCSAFGSCLLLGRPQAGSGLSSSSGQACQPAVHLIPLAPHSAEHLAALWQPTEKRRVGRPIEYYGDADAPNLTPAERRRIRRRIANRESARRVRSRRLGELEEAQKTVRPYLAAKRTACRTASLCSLGLGYRLLCTRWTY